MVSFHASALKPWGAALLAAALLAIAAPRVHADARMIYYRSPIDNTDQGYGVYVPSMPPPPSGYPCIFHTHGYGWWVGASFSAFQKKWADQHGWVLINLNARGPLFYEGPGETATHLVVEDAVARFHLDRKRLFMTGASMGGTGAYRQGIRHPDVFAAVAGVDGWTDWREWYWHYYARADMRHDIDEFRRPLLNSAAPYYWARQAIWGRIREMADERDTIVFPWQEATLNQKLFDLQQQNPGEYHADLIIRRGTGHGASYDLRSIYDFFLHCAPAGLGNRVRVAAWRLLYAKQGWLRIAGIREFGLLATADSVTRDGRISVWTDNVSAIDVTPADAPSIAHLASCEIWIDGQRVYSGKPQPIHAASTSNAKGALLWWRENDGVTRPAQAAVYTKRPGMSGPVGDCFNHAFVVAYATHGTPDDVAYHRGEAEAFCTVWNNYFVHGPGISAKPEDDITVGEMASHNLVLFGCEDCSQLLSLAERAHRLPVEVRHNSITVREASGRTRTFHGANFGCFFIYPNPLVGGARYLVVAKGQWKYMQNTEALQGLNYDLEELPFAFPDYVVFNTDRSQLPFCIDVNNKATCMCYDAAYFVDVGYFDNHWRLSRDVVTRWVKDLKPDRTKIIHVSDMTRSADAVGVRIVDTGGGAIAKARVTIDSGGVSRSTLSGSDGWAKFSGLTGGDNARLLGVMATACTYDRTADCLAASDCAASTGGLLAAAYAGPEAINAGTHYPVVRFRVSTLGPEEVVADASLTSEQGSPLPAAPVRLDLFPGQEQTVQWQLRDKSDFAAAAGLVRLRMTLRAARSTGEVIAQVPTLLDVCGEPPAPVCLADLKASMDSTGVWQISVAAVNATARPLDVTLRGMIPQAAEPLAAQPTHLDANATATVTWSVPESDLRSWSGPAKLVVYADGLPPASARADLVLPTSGGTDLASAR